MWQVGKTPRRNMAAVRLPLIRGDGDCADAVATSPFSAQIKASMLMKRSSVRMLSAFRIACSMAGEMEMPSSEGRLSVSP